MDFLFFFIASLFILILTVASAITVYKKIMRYGSLLSPLNTVFVGVFLAAYLVHLPINIDVFAEDKLGFLKIIAITFYNVLQMFSLDGDFI